MNPPRSHSQGLARAPRLGGRFGIPSGVMVTRAAAWVLALALVACGGGDGGTYESPADAGPSDASSLDEGDAQGEAGAAGVILPNGCCSTDERTHPHQGEHFDEPNACGTWDYNCDGQVSRLNTGFMKRCDPLPVGGCVARDVHLWLEAEPECGETGTFILRCNADCTMATESRVQRCN